MNDESERPGQTKGIFSKLSQFLSNEPSNRREIIALLKTSYERGFIEPESYSIIQGGLSVSEMQVRDIMIPRSQMTVVSYGNSVKAMLEPIIDSQHSRFPVVGEDDDEVLGILLAKDLLPLLAQNKDRVDMKDLLRPAVFVPQSKRLNALLKEFRESRNHMAIVVDEYGAVDGLVTIEDVLEQIVGDIADEHDFDDEHFIKTAKSGHFLVKAITPIDDFNEHFETKFNEDEFDTIGGLVVHEFGRLPKRNEHIQLGDYIFRILNSDSRSVRLLQVIPQRQQQLKSVEFG